MQIEIIWGGDVNLGRRQHFRTTEMGDAAVFQIPRLGKADLRIFNLECVVATVGEQGIPKGEGGPYYYRARPEMLRLLTTAGCDIVTTANNHSGDYGPEAVLEQMMWLQAAGIASAGTGATPEEAFRPVMKRVGGRTVAVFSIDATQKSFAARAARAGAGQAEAGQAGNAWLSLSDPDSWTQTFTPLIARARQVADHVLVAVHWGPNEAEAPEADEIEAGHRLIDAGADAVLGASAHRLQGVEIYRGCPIIHDAGDLLFDSVRQVPAAGGIFALKLSGLGVEQVEFVPVAVGYGFTAQLEGEAARAATIAYAEKCAVLGTRLIATATGGMIEIPAEDRGRLAAPALPQGCAVPEVPEDARIEPVRLGPLRLLGLRFGPKRMTRRQMLWVESFWDAETVPDADYRISFLAMPSVRGQMPEWGRGMDHDPCDWRVPTGTWSPGVIYRDHYGLRPPPIRLMANVELELVVALIGPKGEVARVKLPHRALPILPSKGAPQFSKENPNYRAAPASVLRAPDLPPGGTWTAEQVAAVTGGRWIVPPPEGWYVRSVVNGTKHVGMRPGPLLFVAHDSYDRSRHENNTYTDRNIDRHDSLPRYRDQLAGAIVSRPVAGLDPALPQLLVQDPIRAHIELGIAGRARFQGEVFAVTGTVGKSSATAMLLHMLGGPDRVLASIDNYNSRVGAPLTLSSLAPDYRAAIVEVAQSGLWMKRGPVTRLIRPTVSLVTAIGLSQTGKGVSRLEDVAKWKSRIFDGLEGRAVAVVGDHLTCHDLVMAEARKHAAEVFTYGKSEGASLRILDLVPSVTGHRVELQTGARRFAMEVPLLGHGMAMNAVAALAALTASGGDPEEAAHSLGSFVTGAARLERIELPCKGGTFEIIDDSWNAEVISMIHALEVMASRPLGPGGRRIAVLGRIVHLGEMGKALHESLAEPVMTSRADHVITHGEEMLHLRELLPADRLGPHFSDAAATVDYIRSVAAAGDTVMVKGSRRDSDFGEICPLLASALLSPPAAE